ncbi:MAG: hypothetical protein A3G18_10420 [Rhodospirillales bacterium RIFCSPLOWO2_12_FULL_58_28]|nr:MAG: hypothetical protein A3H92_08595 [Rhodospirillales bacterium RIFCSPLOWO2_02_FULL_58_16]OHC77689.1 MAG: hypothetical protein A3G18_10420 [Rhodospirillales bacterium RIFCSPLOWO2_12_FULL_58_28]
MIKLTEIQQETITELMNIAVGRAASSLNQLVDEEIGLTVPRVRFIERGDVSRLINEHTIDGACAVTQEFSGPCPGEALLVFPEKKSLELVRAIIGELAPVESASELERDALTEVGNVVLNASLGSLANLLGMEIVCALPEYVKGAGEFIIMGRETGAGGNGDMTMFMEVNFELKQRKINGYMMFILGMDAARKFMDFIDGYMAKAFSSSRL